MAKLVLTRYLDSANHNQFHALFCPSTVHVAVPLRRGTGRAICAGPAVDKGTTAALAAGRKRRPERDLETYGSKSCQVRPKRQRRLGLRCASGRYLGRTRAVRMGPSGPCPGRGGMWAGLGTDPPLTPPFRSYRTKQSIIYINIQINRHTDRREGASDVRSIRRDSAAIFVYSEEDEGAYAFPHRDLQRGGSSGGPGRGSICGLRGMRDTGGQITR